MAIFKANKERWTKDGRKWFFQCYYKDLQGNRKLKRSKLFYKQEEAKTEERKFLSSINLGEQDNNMTFEELFDNYIIYQQDKVKIGTLQDIKKRKKKYEALYKIKLKDYNIKHYEMWKKSINENQKNYQTSYKNTLYKHLNDYLYIFYFCKIHLYPFQSNIFYIL